MRGYACIGLVNPKTPANVGSVLRAADCYGAKMVALSGRRFRSWPTDVTRGWRKFPFLHVEDLHAVIPYDCIPVAVDLIEGAQSLVSYQHPERAFYIFGPEDGTLERISFAFSFWSAATCRRFFSGDDRKRRQVAALHIPLAAKAI
jgi:tRNA(Leu) C34 or U34 (ribose-2'-O)-methylase TrmL